MKKINFLIFLLLFAPILNAQEIEFKKHIVYNFPGIKCIKVIDLDNDGDLDIVGGSEITPTSSSKGIAWWRNDGGNLDTWTKFTVDASFIHVMSVDAAYIDSDSSLDIVASSWQLNQVAWWKNSGNPESGWVKNSIKTNYTNAHDAKCYDMNGDSLIDVIAASAGNNTISVFYNQGGTPPTWDESIVTSGFIHPLSVNVEDMNKDGFTDIVGCADDANDVAWWKHSGTIPVTWQKFAIDNNFYGAGNSFIVDINKDSRPDVLATGWKGNQIAYWVCNDISTNSWTKNIVTSQLDIAANINGSDIDNDGDVDIIAVGKIPGEVSIYYNNNFVWTKQVLISNFTGVEALAVIDIDNDNDLDIITGAGGLGSICIFENTGTSVSGISHESQDNGDVLYQNYPNPFNHYTTFSWSLSTKGQVELKIYSITGKEIALLVCEIQLPGQHQFIFDGQELSEGVYYYTLKAGDFSQTRRFIRIK
jgi:hypothetical protein